MLHLLPPAISTFGVDIDRVTDLIFWIVGAWFLVAEGVLFYFILRYRKRDGLRASWAPGTGKAMAWVLVPVLLVLVCDFIIEGASAEGWAKVKESRPKPDLQVKVVASQFTWNFTYPGKDGDFNAASAVMTSNEFYVPAGKVIGLRLESTDVIHSLWVPSLRLKQDIVPGRSIPAWFEVSQASVQAAGTDTFDLVCSELCGAAHTMMKGKLHVMSAKDFDAWLDKQRDARTSKALERPQSGIPRS